MGKATEDPKRGQKEKTMKATKEPKKGSKEKAPNTKAEEEKADRVVKDGKQGKRGGNSTCEVLGRHETSSRKGHSGEKSLKAPEIPANSIAPISLSEFDVPVLLASDYTSVGSRSYSH
jgi:hypothetical protein